MLSIDIYINKKIPRKSILGKYKVVAFFLLLLLDSLEFCGLICILAL